MSCGSGATDLQTLNNFVLAFHNAGAAAVIGTECLVTSDLAERVGGEIAAALLAGDPLSKAVAATKRSLLLERNPLAFVFNVIGDSRLRVVRA
jgi:hypothetical protein